MKVIAQRINAADFAPFGKYYNMLAQCGDIGVTVSDTFQDHMTLKPLIDTRVHLGLTIGSAAPCRLLSMEKHSHTQEAVLCMKEPVILCVARPRREAPPAAEDVRAFLLEPGDVAVMERETWHDACHGLGHPTGYYWLALAGNAPAVWEKVVGEAEVMWEETADE